MGAAELCATAELLWETVAEMEDCRLPAAVIQAVRAGAEEADRACAQLIKETSNG